MPVKMFTMFPGFHKIISAHAVAYLSWWQIFRLSAPVAFWPIDTSKANLFLYFLVEMTVQWQHSDLYIESVIGVNAYQFIVMSFGIWDLLLSIQTSMSGPMLFCQV